MLLLELAQLRRELEQSLASTAVERDTALQRCEELRSAIEDALRAATDVKRRYENVAQRCHAIGDARSRNLFDEEYRLLRVQFQVNSING